MNINYNDFGSLALARVNEGTIYTTVQNFNNVMISALENSMTVIDSAPPVPKLDGLGHDTLVFFTDSKGPVLTYVPNTGKYPVGTFRIFFNTPNNCTNFALHFTVTFFDDNRITVTSNDAPSVVGRFDVTNLNQSAFNIFIYGILGVAMPAALDQITNSLYNNVQVDQ